MSMIFKWWILMLNVCYLLVVNLAQWKRACSDQSLIGFRTWPQQNLSKHHLKLRINTAGRWRTS